MLSSTLWRALTTPVTYALLTVLVGTAVMQVKYVNRALQRFDSTQVIPIQFVMFTLSVIIGSAILYRDFEKATAENVRKFVGGCLLTFFGVFLITSGRPRNDGEDDEESDEEGEVRIGLADQEPAGEEDLHLGEAPKFASIRRKSKAGLMQNGDGAYDGDNVSESRISSRVSFAGPAPHPGTGRMYSNSSYQPSIRVTGSAPPSELSSGTEETPLLSNAWKNSADDLLQSSRHPGIQNTTSSPVLPSEAQTPSTDSLKPPNESSATQGNVHTNNSILQQGPAPPQAERPQTPARHSISRMMPGPLLSPLSGGLSVVIADSLRRGVDSPLRNRGFTRPRLGLRRTKSGSQRLVQASDRADEELGTSPLKNSEAAQQISKSQPTEGGEWSRMTRARSLSNTLGDLFRGKRQRTEPPDTGGDEEAGPSGS
jgi:hypothetical protein